MKTIPDFAVSSEEAGFDKFLKVYNEYFKFDFFGNAKFYGAKNGEDYQTGQAWITPITPSEAIALLTGKQLTEKDLIVGNRFECIEDSFLKHFTKGLIYPCEKDGTLESNSIRWSEFDSAFLNRHFKLLPTQESVNEIDTFIADHDRLSLKMANEEISHLQKQLKQAKELLLEAELIFRKHAIVSCTRVSINQFLTSNQ